MKKITLLIILVITSISCQFGKDKELNDKSLSVFNNSVEKINKSEYEINIDSFRVAYEEKKSKNSQAGLDFANRLNTYADKLLKSKKEAELVNNIRLEKKWKTDSIISIRAIKEENKNKKIWKNSKYGKLQKKHPTWTDDECRKVINKKIWIGMTYDMLVYQRGKPNTVSPSNYGNGTQYQCCWNDYSPCCFYMKEDRIIYSYN